MRMDNRQRLFFSKAFCHNVGQTPAGWAPDYADDGMLMEGQDGGLPHGDGESTGSEALGRALRSRENDCIWQRPPASGSLGACTALSIPVNTICLLTGD